MRSRWLAALVAGAVAVPLLGSTVAAADPREVPGPSLPATASATAAERASDALERAQALFAEKSPAAARRQAASGVDATMVLNQLMRVMDDLSPADQKQARRLLARPTAPGGDGTVDYVPAEKPPVCSTDSATPICVHYVARSADAPVLTDITPKNGIPDEVDRALATAEAVHSTYVDSGYRRPDPDGAAGGGSNRVDIYLADVGDQGLYGYCTSDQRGSTFNRWAYCVIDEDFHPNQFPTNTPRENQQVTLAHEYFHAVQFAYDAFADGWIMEATATWAEEQLYDGVNDNRQYIPASQIRQPWIPLDTGGGFNVYGNWVYFEYLTQRWPGETGTMPTLVLELWRRMSGRTGDLDQSSTQAIQAELNQRNTSFTKVYGQFADANRRPQMSYSEGGARAYRPARPEFTRVLSSAQRGTPKWFADLYDLTNLAVRMNPAPGLTQRDWRIRVRVDMPPAKTAPVARVAVYLKGGKVRSSAIRHKSRGFSSKVLGFSARNVKFVELVIANASRQSGEHLRRFKFNASIFRR